MRKQIYWKFSMQTNAKLNIIKQLSNVIAIYGNYSMLNHFFSAKINAITHVSINKW